MRPIFTVTLTVIGTILAGVPLLYLTQDAPSTPIQTDPLKETPIKETVSVTVEFSGAPDSLVLQDPETETELASMPAGTSSPWLVELPLPQQNYTALWAVIHWPNADSKNAAQIILAPPQKKECSCTKWTDEGETELNDLYEFRW